MKTMAESKEQKTKAQRALELKTKYESLINEAKDEAIESINGFIGELKELGFEYRLIPEQEYQELTQKPVVAPKSASSGPKRPRKAKDTSPEGLEAAKSANFNAERWCKVCNAWGHDTKAHNFHKEAFKPEELESKGWAAPEGFNKPAKEA